MSQLGEIVLRRALSDGARWPTLSVAVNLSPLQIRDRWLVDLVANVMAEAGIDASRVVLEVTEGVLIDNPQEAQTRLEALRALGVRLALDDFGTGYSSLNYLQKFPFDRQNRPLVRGVARLVRQYRRDYSVDRHARPYARYESPGGGSGERRAAGSASPGRLRRDARLFVRQA